MRQAALALIAAGVALPAIAQEATPIVVRTFTSVAVMQAPPWTTGEQAAAESEVNRQQGQVSETTQAYLLEFIPKGEEFDNWSELYALRAETPLEGSAEGFRNGLVNRITSVCTDGSFQLLHSTENSEIFATFCPRYKDNPVQGEVAVFKLIFDGETLVQNYYHKRGPAFSDKDTASLPIAMQDLRAVISRIDQFHLVDPQ